MPTTKKPLSPISEQEMKPNGLPIPANLSRDDDVKKMSQMVHVFSAENSPDCSFFKVSEPIRRFRSECYEPKFVALGLYGKDNVKCLMMKHVKLELAVVVLKVLLGSTELAKTEVRRRVSEEGEKLTAKWNDLCDHLVPPGGGGEDIWKQYSDTQDLAFPEVQHQLTLDAIFLVSFMLFQQADPKTKSFGIDGFEKYKILLQIFARAEIICNINALNSDIWLFENQIPLRLIMEMVGVMYLDEGDPEEKSSEQKKVAAFRILIRKTFQKALRVLPGNYRTSSGSKPDSVTDRMLKSGSLEQCTHLLECLYKLVCSWDDEEEKSGNEPNDLDSLDNFPREKSARKREERWTKVRSPSPSLGTSKGKSPEEIPKQQALQQAGNINSETGTSSRRMDPQDSRIQSTRQLSNGRRGEGTEFDSNNEQLQPRFCCLQRKTSMCCGDRETAIHVDYILPTVTNLTQAGIRVKSDTSPGCHCKIKVTYSYLPWRNATLHISPLHMDDMDGTAEILLRNMLVQEKVNSDRNKLITYLQCLDDLINTESDVSLLKQGRHPVLVNSSADEKDVATSFNKLLHGSTVYYNKELEDIRREVRSYHYQQWRHFLTEFKKRYWNHKSPWLTISFVAALMLLVLTCVQTIYTVRGFNRKS